MTQNHCFVYLTIPIGPSNVRDGDQTMILGLIWTLIQYSQTSACSINSRLLAWINAQIPNRNIANFTTDWNDGVALCALVEHIEPDLRNREKKSDDCSHGIKLAEELGVVKIIKPDDLCDQNIEPYRVITYVSSFYKPANERLLNWVQGALPDQNVTNLNTNWQNGVNLAYLLNALKPGLFRNCRELDPKKAVDNLTKAMEIGEKHFGVKPVFTPSQLADGEVDELSLATYLTQLQQYSRSIPNNIICTGHGLTKAFLGRPATFEIDTTRRGAEESDLSITIVDSKQAAIKPQITPSGKGRFRIEYTPWSTGKLKIEIKWKNVAIPDSPFSIDVIDMTTLSFNLIEKCIKIGDPILFDMKGTNDVGDLHVLLQDTKGATDLDAKVDDIVLKSEGVVECSLKTTQPGKYKVVAKLAGVDVAGSPFQIEVADPQRYIVQMSEPTKDGRLTMNKPATFTITATEANSGCLVAKLQSPGASEPKDIRLIQQNGSFSGKFTPTEGGVYKILVTCTGENIPGSPIQLTASDPHSCFFYEELPQFIQVGVPYKVNLSTKGAGLGDVEVTSSQTDIMAISGEHNEDLYTIQFTPNRVGESMIDVKFDEVSVPPTPHTISVCDASKCIASGAVLESGCAKSNEQFAVTVHTKGAGKGELTVKLSHGPKTTYTRTPEGNSNGTYNFTLTSYEAGIHSLNILWGGVPIPNSPYTIKVTSDATQFMAQGEGLKEAVARQPAQFVLKGPQSGLIKEDMLQVVIKDARFASRMVSKEEFNPLSEEALVCVTDNQKGSYSAEYSVPSHGNYTLYVTIDDKSIPGSPFNIKVHPAFDPSQCTAFGKAIELPNSLVLGRSIEFMVDTTEAGTGEITAIATDPMSSESRVFIAEHKSDWKKKIYELKFDPKVTGEHKVDVYWNKKHIPSSPFSFDICDPSKVRVLDLPKASSYIAEVEKPLTFIVNAKDAGKGRLECTVKVSSNKVDQLDEILVEPVLQQGDTYTLEFTPHKVGQMQLDLTYNGENILSGPWECEIADPESTQASLLSSNSHQKQHQPVKFMVSRLTKRMANKLKISINHPRHKNPKFQKEKYHESSIVYHFIPEQLGKYNINVKVDDKDIHGSPLSVKVVNPEACIIKGEVPASIFIQQRKQFMVDTSKAGPGELSCQIENQETNEQNSTPKLAISCETISTDPENAIVEVSGLESGKCKLFLKWGGYSIPDMPLDITVYDPSQCSYMYEQNSTGKLKTGDKVSVLINTTKVGGCKPTVKANGPTVEYTVETEKTGEGEYRASFIPHEYGRQSVEILVDDVLLPDCPLIFETCTPKVTQPVDTVEDSHREIILQQSESTSVESAVTFVVGVETNDVDTSKLHLKTVNPKKRYRVSVEEKSREWKTTCTALDKGEQELRVLCSESELIGRPIKVSVGDQEKSSRLNYCKVILAALLMLLILSVVAILSLNIIDPEIKPI